MRLRSRFFGLVGLLSILTTIGPVFGALIPPGRQHRLSIEGENTITFLPQSNLPAIKIDYKARFEYIVDTFFLKEPKAAKTTRAKAKDSENPATKPSREVDISLHSTEIAYRQNGQPVLETKMSRSKFQGRLQPDSPVLSVSAKEAPLRLQELLKLYDTTAATMMVNDNDRVTSLKLKFDGPQRPVVETVVSIHSPMPSDVDSWDASSRLAMGQGQTAKGKLRFEKVKKPANKEASDLSSDLARANKPEPVELVKVKVSGVLQGEGVIAGNLIKDGTYTVDGEQSYDPQTREWVASKWSVEVNSDLANQAGLIVARAKGRMIVESRAVDGAATPTGEGAVPKL